MKDSIKSARGVTIGMDIGDRSVQVYALGRRNKLLIETSVSNTQDSIESLLQRFERSTVVIEAGTHSPWISRLVEAKGHKCIVANPRKLQLITCNEKKTDRVDAEYLARIGKAMPKLLHPIRHRGLEAQKDLAIVRARCALVKVRTSLVNSVRSIFKSFGYRLPPCDSHYFHKRALPHVPKQHQSAIQPLLLQIESVSKEITLFDQKISALCEQKYAAETRRLQAVSGVGPLISLAFVLTLEDPKRFRKSRQVGAYLGLVPRQNASGDSNPQLRITKRGNSYLRQLLVTGAQYILSRRGPDCDLKRHGERIAQVGGKNAKKRAVVAVARKLAVLLHRLWARGEEYLPNFKQPALETTGSEN